MTATGESQSDFVVKKKPKAEDEGLWLYSFADMSMILLSFFVLLISMSKVDQSKFDNVQSKIIKTPKKVGFVKESLESLQKQLEAEVKKKNLQEMTELRLDVDGLAIELKDKLMFSPGSYRPNKEFAGMVGSVLDLIAKASNKYKIVVEGHTDDTPLKKGGVFPSNWELSSARGISILRTLEGMGVPEERIAVTSYAHTRPKFKIEGLVNEALIKARSGNRRVVIRLESL